MVPISVVPASEEEASNFADGECNILSLDVPEVALSEEQRLNITLKESVKTILEENTFQEETNFPTHLPGDFVDNCRPPFFFSLCVILLEVLFYSLTIIFNRGTERRGV